MFWINSWENLSNSTKSERVRICFSSFCSSSCSHHNSSYAATTSIHSYFFTRKASISWNSNFLRSIISSPRHSTRSTRGIGPTRFLPEGCLSNALFPGLVEFSEVSASDSAMAYMCAVMTESVTGLLECSDPLIYAAMARKMDPDNSRYHESMSGWSDSELPREAMVTP